MIPQSVRTRLWHEGADKNVFVILDGAQNDGLLDLLYDTAAPAFECLFADAVEPDVAEVAPYLIELHEEDAFTQWLLARGWAQSWGIFLTSSESLADVWRHLREHTQVRGPDQKLLYFRFYDPRVLNAFLPTCDEKQLAEFFGDEVDFFLAEVEGGQHAVAYSLAAGKLVSEQIEAS